MNSPSAAVDGPSAGHLFKLLALLWMVGAATRVPILAVPPVIASIHHDLHLAETQVGLLVSLPLVMFALAAIPGSLLIARIGVLFTVVAGLAVAAVGSALRGLAPDIVMLYAATALMAFGVAILQPALPQLVSQWLPRRIALGTAVYTNGVLIGTTSTAVLTIPFLLPWVGGSWRLALVVWTVPVAAAVLVLILLAPRDRAPVQVRDPSLRQWWPDWKSPVIWLLGAAFGGNNSIFFGANAFLPDYLTSQGRPDLISAALGGLNGAQLFASFVLMAAGARMHRRAWPFLVFGTISLVALVAIMFADGLAVVVLTAIIGFSTSITFVILLAMPAVLSPPESVHRTAAGMFTISYTGGVIVPTLGGALWDLTGAPWTAFCPLAVCALVLTVAGLRLARLPVSA